MKNNNYTSFFKPKPKKVERYIRCRKCGGNMEWSRDFPPQIKCTKCCICCEKQGGCDNRCDMMDSYEYAEECEDYVKEDEP